MAGNSPSRRRLQTNTRDAFGNLRFGGYFANIAKCMQTVDVRTPTHHTAVAHLRYKHIRLQALSSCARARLCALTSHLRLGFATFGAKFAIAVGGTAEGDIAASFGGYETCVRECWPTAHRLVFDSLSDGAPIDLDRWNNMIP